MSGTWMERAVAGEPLKGADVHKALRDLLAVTTGLARAVEILTAQNKALAGRVTKLDARTAPPAKSKGAADES